jgi:parallel beta-helix repeat protein
VINNKILQNQYDGIFGVELTNGILGNNEIIANQDGVHLLSLDNMTVKGNLISNNSGFGIIFESASRTDFSENIIFNNDQVGIGVYYSTTNRISNNSILNNSCGIGEWSSTGQIFENRISNNTQYGVFIMNSNGNSISKNNITSNGMGLLLDERSDSNNIVLNNISSNQGIGVRLDNYSNYNNIQSNIFNRNLDYAIVSSFLSVYNRIDHNDFFNNNNGQKQARDDASHNYWNDATEGNHWSDFDEPAENCYDDDKNGICDSSYAIPGGATDKYPLTNWWPGSRYGSISGTVTNGKYLIPATIIIENKSSIKYWFADMGVYKVSNLFPGPYNVSATASGCLPSDMKQITVIAGKDITVNFALNCTAKSGVKGIVTDAIIGTPLEGVRVRLMSSDIEIGNTSTDSMGFYAIIGLEPKFYELIFSKEGYEPQAHNLSIPAGQVMTLNIQLAPLTSEKGTIKGNVTDIGTGQPLGNASVRAFLSGTKRANVTTGDNGTFALTGLDPGGYDMEVFKEGYDIHHGNVTVEKGKVVIFNVQLKKVEGPPNVPPAPPIPVMPIAVVLVAVVAVLLLVMFLRERKKRVRKVRSKNRIDSEKETKDSQQDADPQTRVRATKEV